MQLEVPQASNLAAVHMKFACAANAFFLLVEARTRICVFNRGFRA